MSKATRTRWSGLRLLPLLAAAVVVVPARAQGPVGGTLRGVVVDEAGAELGEALVMVTAQGSGMRWSSFTPRAGRFAFAQLPAGDYDVVVERLGFAATRLQTVAVRPGRTVELVIVLGAGVGEGQGRVSSGHALRGGLPGTGDWLPGFAFGSLPGARGELDESLRLSTWADDRLGIEGLPFFLSTLAVDGVPFRPARHPVLPDRPALALLPVAGVASAEVVGGPFDVEWAGSGAAVISVHGHRGTARPSLRAAGHWSGSPVSSPGAFDAAALDYQSLGGSVLLGGPAAADSARYAVGLQARRWEVPRSAAWPVGELAAQLADLGAARGLDLAAYRAAAAVPDDAIAGFGTLDWRVGAGKRLELSVNAASLPGQGAALTSGELEFSGSDLVARASLLMQSDGGVSHTSSVSAAASRRETTAAGTTRATVLVPGDLRFGAGAAVAVSESQVRLAHALELSGRSHSLKFGAELSFSSFEQPFPAGGGGSYGFGGLPQLQAGTGVYTRTVAAAASTSWSQPRFGVHLQDRWRSGSGVELVVGAKLAHERPDPTVRRDAEWLRLSGTANDVADISGWSLSPRAALTWDVEQRQEWLIHAAAGVYFDRIDPLLVAAWKLDDGTAETLRATGNVGAAWPSSDPSGGIRAPRLTMLGPQFRAPRTSRVSAGLAHRVADGTAIELSGVYRDTRYLPRRADLNLIPAASARDGAGRAVFGVLQQQGGLLFAEPGSNRRFPGYDEVAALNVDGWSRYWGATLSAQRLVSGGLSLIARYTFSRTTDNWFGAAAGTGWDRAAPAMTGTEGDWTEGTSDFDLPHRVAAGAVLETPFGLRLSALYRWQSGRPFTAGFSPGVDANGDGTAGNDPAFIDPAVPGAGELFGKWSCLQERSGRLAERNGCRGPGTHTLDLQLSARLLRLGRGALSVQAEALDLLETDFSLPDAALYLVDPGGSVQLNPAAGSIRLPLLVNQDFGQPLARARSGRLLRLGAAVTW